MAVLDKSSKLDPILSRIRDRLYYEGFSNISCAPGRTRALIVDGARVEIRCAAMGADGKWRVNIHRHGEVDERGVDAYLFMLLNVPGNASLPLYVVLRAPVERLAYQFSFSSLMRRYKGAIEDWKTLSSICRER